MFVNIGNIVVQFIIQIADRDLWIKPISGTEVKLDWKLISDCSFAIFLRTGDNSERRKRLSMTLQDAVNKDISLIKPYICNPDTTVREVITRCDL